VIDDSNVDTLISKVLNNVIETFCIEPDSAYTLLIKFNWDMRNFRNDFYNNQSFLADSGIQTEADLST